MPKTHTATTSPPYAPTAAEAVKTIYGMTLEEFVLELIRGKDGEYKHLFVTNKEASA